MASLSQHCNGMAPERFDTLRLEMAQHSPARKSKGTAVVSWTSRSKGEQAAIRKKGPRYPPRPFFVQYPKLKHRKNPV